MSDLTQDQIKQLKSEFPHLKFKLNYPLSKITYFKIGGPAQALVKVDSLQDFIKLVTLCRDLEIKTTILGGASNVIVSDQGVTGLVIIAQYQEFTHIDDTPDSKLVCAEAGIPTALLVKKTVESGLTGLEPFVGVPGRLGGAVFNNAHYQQQLLSDYITQVEVLTPGNERLWLQQAECGFAYDYSRFQESGEIILQVELRLQPGTPQVSQELIKESTLHRIQTQPLNYPSSGCIFKNVPNSPHLQQLFPEFKQQARLSAGFLIDQAGLKGVKQGSIQVSDKHAAFMINTNGGTAADVLTLIEQVKQTVKTKFQLELEEEVFWIE